jgi:hypothetical protein
VKRWGYFKIFVNAYGEGWPVFAEYLARKRPDADGVVWIRERRDWWALKRYGPNLGLSWLAGRQKRVDERWRRIDEVLDDLAPLTRSP